MIKYFCKPDAIEPNAHEIILGLETEVDKIAVFPDVHYSSKNSIPVGVAFESTDKFYPLITGKDIGCGVAYLKFLSKDWIKPFDKNKHYKSLNSAVQLFSDDGLGGGNHFLSIEQGDNGNTYLICHTGTRNLGIFMYQQLNKLVEKFNIEQGSNSYYLPIEYFTEELKLTYDKILDYGVSRRKTILIKLLEFLKNNGYVNSNCAYVINDSIHNVFRISGNKAYHYKGASELSKSNQIVIPISMSRGSLIVAHRNHFNIEDNIYACSHGAGRKLSRTDTLKFWHSMKAKIKKEYEQRFSELLDKSGKFPNSYIEEFDFAYKESNDILLEQPFIMPIEKTYPIVTFKQSNI
jgi:hypothetical protein